MSRTGRVPDTSSASIGGPCVQTTPLLLSEHPRSSSLSSVVIIRPLSSPFPVSSSSSRPNRLLRGAAGERDTMVDPVGFAEAWRAQFPDSEPPRMELRSARDIEAELASCKRNIRRLEVEVNKERFRMIYLQTLLAKEKKSYDRQRWGFRKSGPEGDRGEARRSPAESHCGAEARADGEQRAVCAAHSPSTLRRCDAEPEFDCDDPTVSRGPPLVPGALASRARRSRGAGPLPGQPCVHGAMNRTKSESSPGLSTAAVGTAGGKPSRVPCLSAGQEPCKLRRHSSQTGEGTQVSSSSGGSSGGGDGGGGGGVGAGGGGGMALPTYANVEFHHERGLIRLNERDVSEHITNLGSEAMRFEQQQRRRRLTSATSPGRAEPPASSAAHRAHRQGYGSFETPDRDDAILAEISPRFLKDGLLPLSCVPTALRNIGVEGDLVSALSRQSAPSTTPKEERLSWPKRSNSPSSLEDAGGGYTPDCSSNDNLTSSEEELSSPGCHPGYPGPSASPTSHGASPGSYRLFRDRENRSPSQNSQQSLDSSSPPTPHGAAASVPGGPSVGGASGHGASGAKRATRKTTAVPAKIPSTTTSVPDSPQRSPASSGFRRSGQSRPRQGMVDEVFEGCSDMPFNMASPGCVFENERTDERMPTQDGMPYIDDSPSSSPQLSSKGKACRDVALTVPLDAGKSAVRDSDKGLEMRKWVLSGILTSEETYLSHLEALLLPMKPLRAAATTSQPVISVQQVDIIFFRVPELYQVHREFYQALQPRVQQWIHSQCVGDLFQKLASQLGVYRAFVDNYKSAVETAERCCQGNAQFAEISENLKVRSSKEMKEQASKHTLEALLYKPVDRVTRSTLVLHDLLKHTPTNHPDYPLLQDALRISQSFLSSINEEITPRRQSVTVKKGESRQLVKDGFLVELAEGTRKLRHVFLFTDLLLCAKLKKQAPGKPQQYDCKWYIPLADLSFQHPEDMYDTGQPVPVVPDEDIEAMKIKISQIKNDMQREKKGGKSNKALERLRKKLSEQESLLLLTSPTMPLRVHNRNGKSFMFITSSDYERAEWREAMREQQKKCFKSFALSSVELQMLTNSCVKLQTVHSIPLTINKEDDESPGLYGFLNIIVHSASGFRQSANLYCTLEVDSYGYFVNKAKTRVYRDTTEPNWNEEFEIELEGSQTLRLLCYDKCYDKAKLGKDEAENVDKIMGKGQIQLDLGVLQEKDWQRAVLPMNGIEVKLSVKFTSREFSLKRMPSRKQTGVYGVKIGVVTKRERSKVPYLVRQCVEEIEKRGLDEVGIYRVSGVATDIQALKAAFDSNDKDASVLMSDMDVNAIAGALKLYFRELPEPLFTDELYPSFVEAIALSEPVAKESCMLNILQTLPEPNLNTFLFLLAHLKRVAEMEPVNKMSLHNLATVFGPTLLRPSEKDTKIVANPAVAITMSDSWSLEVMSQVQVLLYFLQLESIPKPDSKRQSLLFSTEV